MRRNKSSNTPICRECIYTICANKKPIKRVCPLCRSNDWTRQLSLKYPKTKKSFAQRQVIQQEKKRQKQILVDKRSRLFARWIKKGMDGTCPWYETFPSLNICITLWYWKIITY